VPPNEDNACRAAAEHLHQIRPQWLVIWGCYSRRFWAFPLFDTRHRIIVNDTSPQAVLTQMDQAERTHRTHPGEMTGDDPYRRHHRHLRRDPRQE
jgi:hypothetical protein